MMELSLALEKGMSRRSLGRWPRLTVHLSIMVKNRGPSSTRGHFDDFSRGLSEKE